MAKQFGLIKSQDSVSPEEMANGVTRTQKAADRRERARRIGEQIHLQHLEMVYSNQAKANEELEIRVINTKTDFFIKIGMTEDEAKIKAATDFKKQKEEKERKEILREYKMGN